jgi:hypothetical protein
MNRLLLSCGVALTLGCAGMAKAAPFDGSFGTAGNFSDSSWTAVTGSVADPDGGALYEAGGYGWLNGVSSNSSAATSAVFTYSQDGSLDDYATSLSQTFDLASSQAFNFSFYLSNITQITGNTYYIDVLVNGVQVYCEGNTGAAGCVDNAGGGGHDFRQVSLDDLVGSASGVNTIEFVAENDNSSWFVSAPGIATLRIGGNSVPAPAGIGIFMVAMSGLGMLRRRRRA